MSPPVEEPVPEWNYFPQFLADNHVSTTNSAIELSEDEKPKRAKTAYMNDVLALINQEQCVPPRGRSQRRQAPSEQRKQEHWTYPAPP